MRGIAGHQRRAMDTDRMFLLRQLVEKRLQRQRNMALIFVILKKPLTLFRGKMAMATVRCMGAPLS